MLGPLGQLVAVTRNAFIEAIRQPFYVVWLTLITLGLVLIPYLAAYTFENDDVLAADMSLSMLLVGGLLLSVFTAAGVVSREIENRTVLTVISKPLPRPLFIVGKFLGVAGACVLAWYSWCLIALLALRQGAFSTVRVPWDFPVLIFGSAAVLLAVGVAAVGNFVFNRHFGASFARWLAVFVTLAVLAVSPFDHAFALRSPAETFSFYQIISMLLVLQGVILFCGIAVAASTRLSTVPTLVVCLVVFLLGVTSDYFFGAAVSAEAGAGRTWGQWAGTVAYSIVPNLQYLSLSDAVAMGTVREVGIRNYVLPVVAYMATLTIGAVALAVALFQSRQTG